MQQEIWKDIAGYEGLYQVSNQGNVRATIRRGTNGSNLKLRINVVGYYYVNLFKNGKGKNQLVHRLVTTAFLPNPLGKPQVNHKDGNKLNNNLDNLEWSTPKENTQHSLKVLGVRRCHGENNPKSCKIGVFENDKCIGIYYGFHETARALGMSSSGVEYAILRNSTTKKGYKIKKLCK